MLSRPHVDGTLTSRHECKYLIDEPLAHRVRQFIKPFLVPDPHSLRRTELRYPVYSLYLDTVSLRFYRDTLQGIKNRFKLRLRYYSEDDASAPVFFEVKKRVDKVVRKSRECVDSLDAEAFLHGRGGREAIWRQRYGKDFHEFLQRCRATRARPTVRIHYLREAYESRGGDPVRITFDSHLHHSLVNGLNLIDRRIEWRPTPVNGVILEVKFTERCPQWVRQMIRSFQLDRQSVPKYVMSVAEVIATGRSRQLRANFALAGRSQMRRQDGTGTPQHG